MECFDLWELMRSLKSTKRPASRFSKMVRDLLAGSVKWLETCKMVREKDLIANLTFDHWFAMPFRLIAPRGPSLARISSITKGKNMEYEICLRKFQFTNHMLLRNMEYLVEICRNMEYILNIVDDFCQWQTPRIAQWMTSHWSPQPASAIQFYSFYMHA